MMMMMFMMKYEYCMNVIIIRKCTLLHKRTVIMSIWRNINEYNKCNRQILCYTFLKSHTFLKKIIIIDFDLFFLINCRRECRWKLATSNI